MLGKMRMKTDIFDLPPQEYFDAIGNDESSWSSTADSLLQSAEILISHIGDPSSRPNTPESIWDWVRIHYVARMLRGMALECLLKAMWIKSGGILAKDGKYKNVPGTKNHDLYSLYEKINEKTPLNFDEEQLQMIARLSFAIVNARYPTKKSFTGAYPSKPNGKDHIRWNKWEYPKDENVFQGIIKKVKQVFLSNENIA